MDMKLFGQLKEAGANLFTPQTDADILAREKNRPPRWVAFIPSHEDYHDLYLVRTAGKTGEYEAEVTGPCSIVGWNDENVYTLSSGNSFEECATEAGVIESYGDYNEELGKYVLSIEQVKQLILGSEADGDSSYGLAYIDLVRPENNLGNVTVLSEGDLLDMMGNDYDEEEGDENE